MSVPKITKIRIAIERKRNELHKLSDRYGINSDRVIQKSQELDDLLNQYGQRPTVMKE